MSTAAGSRLSDLPDDLLQRILYFVPAKEAASTAVLARRWRALWPTLWGAAAAVHLDTRSYVRTHAGDNSVKTRHAVFFQGAKETLDEHGSVKRLTIHVEEENYNDIRWFIFGDDDHNMVDDVLSHPACRDVEELRIEAYTPYKFPAAGSKYVGSSMPRSDVGHYELSFGSVPSQALRDLHITNCNNLTSPPQATFFPCLAVLRLQSCGVSLDSLQDMIMASPQLDTLHLDYVFIRIDQVCLPTNYQQDWYNFRGHLAQIQSLCCPTITTLMLVNCCYEQGRFTIELDAPRVSHFRYSGHVNMFPLKSPPPDLRRVDLHIFDNQECTLFWPFLMKFRNTKALKLELQCPIEDIAVAEKKRHDELLGDMLFSNLELLEVDGKHKNVSNDAAVAIGNLLQCCPAVVDLRIKLKIADNQAYRRIHSPYRNSSEHEKTLLNRKAELDFLKSISHFIQRKDQVVSFGRDDKKYEVSGIPGLSDKWFNFNCLQFYLKRVSLQFSLGKSDSFGVQLANFFFEEAKVLEEMYIDDGNNKMCEHINRKLGGRTINPLHPCSEYKVFPGISQELGVKRFSSSYKIRERLPSTGKHDVRRRNSWSRGFAILPLER